MMRLRSTRGERGAAAVEFALILPVLLALVLGLIEFSLVFNSQISMTNAAREGARHMAIHNNQAEAKLKAVDAAESSTVDPALDTSEVVISPSVCAKGETVTVTIEHDQDLITGFFPFLGDSITLTGQGVMLCGG